MEMSSNERSSWPPRLSNDSPHLHHLKRGRDSLRTAMNRKKIEECFDHAQQMVHEPYPASNGNDVAPSFIAQSQAVLDGSSLSLDGGEVLGYTGTSSSLPDLSDNATFGLLDTPQTSGSCHDFTEWRQRNASGSFSSGSSFLDPDELLEELFSNADMPNLGDEELPTTIGNDEATATTMTEQRKEKHNQTEKNRRHNFNRQIKDLEELLPKRKSFETRPTKNAVLKSSADYIKQLKMEREEALRREAQAKKSAEYYERMCKELMIKLNKGQAGPS